MPLASTTRCFRATLTRLRQSPHGGNLSASAVRQLRRLSRELGSDIVETYSAQVAANEVGLRGSGRATNASPLNGSCPTGLLYGRIQSGKTNAMILTSAVAIDNSFKIVIVLTSDNFELVRQTVNRFRSVTGPLVYASDDREEWEAERAHMRSHIGTRGVIFVCAKNAHHLPGLLATLENIGAGTYPALIIDDEADQATPDTTAAARALRHASAPRRASAIHRRTIANDDPDELGASLRERLPHNVFLQVTATPNALFLQNTTSPLRPSFTRLLRPGSGYQGGEHFFSHGQVTRPSAPIVHVDENERAALTAGNLAPRGLRSSILFFLVSSTAYLLQNGPIGRGMKHLSHTSPNKRDHAIVREMLGRLLDEISSDFSTFRPEFERAYRMLAADARLRLPAFRSVLEYIREHLPNRRIILANSEGSYGNFAPEYNFIVGGNILGRGLTIDNLITTYYLRRPRTAQMDTMQQHARMYGYRRMLMPYTRVFVPRTLAIRFMLIHESETAQRTLIEEQGARHINVRIAGDLRPTRAGVLIPSMIGTYRAGQQIYPVQPIHNGNPIRQLTAQFDRTIRAAYPIRRLQAVDLGFIETIVRSIPIDPEDPGSWNTDKILAALQIVRQENGRTRGFIFHRDAPNRQGPDLAVGIAGQPEVVAARRTNSPVLMMFRVAGEKRLGWSGTPFWYPTLVFPGQTTVVFNWS